MAESNGSLIFDTQLDNSGFEKGSDKLLAAIKDLTSSVDNLGDNMMASFQQVIPLLKSTATAASAISETLEKGATQAESAGSRIAEAEAKITESAKTAEAAVSAEGDGFTAMVGKSDQARNSMSQLEKDIVSVGGELDKLSASTETGFSNVNAVLNFERRLESVNAKIDSARQRLNDFGESQVPTENYARLTTEMEKAEQTVARLTARQNAMRDNGVNETSKQWQALDSQLYQAEDILSRYQRRLEQMRSSGEAFISGADTDDYARMSEALTAAEAHYSRNLALINAAEIAQARLNVRTAQERVELAATEAKRQRALEALQQAQEELQAAAAASVNGGADSKASPEKATPGWDRLASALAKVGSAAKSTVKSLGKMGLSALKRGAEAAANGFKKLFGHFRGGNTTAKALVKSLTSVKTMLLARLKRSFITDVWNEAQQGLQALSKYSSAFNQAMSNIKNSSKELSANISVSIGGFIQAIEPIVTGLLDRLTQMVRTINALFASISGKSGVITAKKQTTDYAASLDQAAGAAKDLNRQVYGFDELNKGSDSGSGGSSGSGGAGDLFQTETVDANLPDTIKAMMDKIRGYLAEDNWKGIGEEISSGLNSVLSGVSNWITGTAQPFIYTWVGRISELLNGLVSGFDWPQLATILGNGLNTVLLGLHTFLTTFDFWELGQAFADGINNAFDTINWVLLGQTLAAGWNDLVTFLHRIILQTDWFAIGSSIGSSIDAWFTRINWTLMAATITRGVDALVQSVRGFIQAIDWLNLATELGGFVTSLVTNINWENVGALLNEALRAILKAALGILVGIDWFSVAEGLTDGFFTIISDIDWIKLLGALGELLVLLVTQAFQALTGIVSGTTSFLAELFHKIGWDGIAGFFDGITEKLRNLKTWVKEHIVDPTVNAVKDFLGIHSPSTVFAGIGHDVIQGFFNGLTEKLQQVRDKIAQKWETIKTDVVLKFDSLKTTLHSRDWTSIGANLVSGVKAGITNNWSSFSSWVSEKFSSVITGVKKVFGIHSPSTVFAGIGENLDKGLQIGMDAAASDLLRNTGKIAQSVTDEMQVQGSAALVLDPATNALKTLTDRLSDIAQIFQRITDSIISMGGLTIPAIATGSVIPYKARLDATAAENNASMSGGITDVRNLLADILAAINSGDDAGTPVIVKIGDEKVAEHVIRKIRNTSRATSAMAW